MCSFSLMYQICQGSEVPAILLCMSGQTGSDWYLQLYSNVFVGSYINTHVMPYNCGAIHSTSQLHTAQNWNRNVPTKSCYWPDRNELHMRNYLNYNAYRFCPKEIAIANYIISVRRYMTFLVALLTDC